MEYKGYTINEIFRYAHGVSDWEVFKDESGVLFHQRTLEQVKDCVDEMVDESDPVEC